jgi:hypothetical protein
LRNSRTILSGNFGNSGKFYTNSNVPSQSAILPAHAVFSERSFVGIVASMNEKEIKTYGDFTSRLDAAVDEHNRKYPQAEISVLDTWEEPHYTADLLMEDKQNSELLKAKMLFSHPRQYRKAKKEVEAD